MYRRIRRRKNKNVPIFLVYKGDMQVIEKERFLLWIYLQLRYQQNEELCSLKLIILLLVYQTLPTKVNFNEANFLTSFPL